MSIREARRHVEKARAQLDQASIDSWEPPDPGSCISNVFYAYENLVVAVAEAHNIPWKKIHSEKAKLAAKLHKEGKLSRDLSEELPRLNDLRKDVHYGFPGNQLEGEDLESLVSDLEATLDEVDGSVRDLEEGKDNE